MQPDSSREPELAPEWCERSVGEGSSAPDRLESSHEAAETLKDRRLEHLLEEACEQSATGSRCEECERLFLPLQQEQVWLPRVRPRVRALRRCEDWAGQSSERSHPPELLSRVLRVRRSHPEWCDCGMQSWRLNPLPKKIL